MKVYINGPGHMTKMTAMPIYGKNLKKSSLQNQKSYDLETAIFHGCKNDNFHLKFFDYFHIFAQNIDRGYRLEPPQ